jgi:V8-like Glu-specific endopeptidase
MAWDKNMSNLRNVLAGLYWNVEEARRIVLEVGMNPAFVSFSNRSINTWTSILDEAQHHQKVQDIIAKAREEYPTLQSLALAEQNLLLAVEAPEISDAAWHGPRDADQLEKIIGAIWTLRPISFLQRGLEMSRPVARVVLADGSRGSGFLIKDNVLITNNHVIPSSDVAQGATVEFNYQKTVQGLDAEVDPYKLAPDEGFATSPEEEQGGDDWTAVRVQGNPNAKWGALSLTRANPKAQDEVIIIQHPGGGPKQIALSHNVVAFVNDKRLQYLTDTLEGSSGSPVFDTNWQVVALHHKGGWLREPGSKRTVYRNQGIHINVVIDGLTKAGLV